MTGAVRWPSSVTLVLMSIEVRTDEMLAAAARLRSLGRRVSSYGHLLDGRVGHAAGELDDDVASSLRSAWAEVARAIDVLAVGFERYGGALADVAASYDELERRVTIRGRR